MQIKGFTIVVEHAIPKKEGRQEGGKNIVKP